MTAIGILFPLAALGSAAILTALAAPDIPRISGTVALVLTIAALGVAILH